MFENIPKEKKKKIFYASLILVLVVIFIFRGFANSAKTEDVSETKQKVSLLSLAEYNVSDAVLSTSGKIESLADVELRSEVFGKVSAVYVKLGQEVFPGQTLVVFNNADLAAQRQQAEAGLEQAMKAKEQLIAQYSAAQANHDKVLVATENAVASAKTNLDSAENNLKLNSDASNSAIVRDQYDTAYASLSTVQNTLQSTLTSSDGILGIDNSFSNDSVEKYLSTLNINAKSQAENSYYIAKRDKKVFDDALVTLSINSSQEELDGALVKAQTALQTMNTHLVAMTTMLDNTMPVGNISQVSLDTMKASIQGARTAISGQYSAVLAQKHAIETAKTSLSGVELVYDKAVRDYEAAKAQAESDKKSSAAQLEQSRVSLESQDSVIKNARGSVNAVNAQLGKTIVRSPIHGTIAVLPAKVGELISNGNLVVSVVNDSSLQIKAYIDSKEKSLISVGNKVSIGENGKGIVTHIAPSIDPMTKKIEVVIAIDEESKNNFVIGEFADVNIQQNPKEGESNSYFLPLESIKMGVDGKFVYTVDENNKIIAVPVEVDRIQGATIEVISGLDETQSIIKVIGGLTPGETVEVIVEE